MHPGTRTIGGLLICGWLTALAAEPVAELPSASLQPLEPTELQAVPPGGTAANTAATEAPGAAAEASAGLAPALRSSPLLAAGPATELQVETSYVLPEAGICPVIDDLVRQSCAQYPDDPSCQAQ